MAEWPGICAYRHNSTEPWILHTARTTERVWLGDRCVAERTAQGRQIGEPPDARPAKVFAETAASYAALRQQQVKQVVQHSLHESADRHLSRLDFNVVSGCIEGDEPVR